MFLCGVVAAHTGAPLALAVGAAAALILIATRLVALDRTVISTLLMAVALLGAAQALDLLTPALIGRALVSGLSLGAFLLSLHFLAPAVERSDLVERVGRFFVRQPPGRRYYAISVGVNMMGLLLSISVIPLFLTMVRRTLDESPTPIPDTALRTIRRRSAAAIQRGISMVPLWSPVSIIIVVLSGMIPDFVWLDYLPLGIALSVTLILVGRRVDRFQNPGVAGLSGFAARFEPAPLAALLTIMALVPAIAWAASQALSGPRLLGLLLAFPVVGLLFYALQSAVLGRSPLARSERAGFAAILHQRYRVSLREVSVFVSVGVVSILAVPIFRHMQVADLIAALPIAAELALFVCVIVSLALSVLGISPLITATLMVDMFIQPNALDVHRALLILSAAFLVGHSWLVSPVSFGTMSVSRDLSVPTREILIRWNLPYVICAIAVFGLMVTGFAVLG